MGALRYLPLFTLFLGCFVTVNGQKKDLISEEMRLYDHIISNNNPNVRPVHNFSETIHVKFGISLISILDVDEKKGALTTQVWTRMLWKDNHVAWNPADFGGVDHIRIPIEKLWQPDIVLYNAAESGGTKYEEALAVVSSDGTVMWIPPMILKSSCSMDMSRFPFDKQWCMIKFGSWTYDGFKVDLDFYDDLEKIDVTDYIMNNEWDLVDHPARKNVKHYPCCEEPYPDLTFTLVLQRRGGFQSLIYVAPILFLAILCPIIFLLPYSETQRFSLGGSLLICLAIMLSSFERIFPSAHHATPALAKYYTVVVILLVLSLIMSAVIINIADRATRPYALPRIIKKIFVDVLGRVLCVSPASYALMNEGNPEEGSTGQKKSASGAAEWRALAQVLDRFCFVAYVVLTIIFALVFLS